MRFVFMYIILLFVSYSFADNVVELLTNLGETTLVSYLRATGLDKPLSNNGPFTVFAPTNTAFGDLFKDGDAKSQLTNNIDLMKHVLLYHVADGRTYSNQLHNEMLIQSLEPTKQIRVNINNGITTVNGFKVISEDRNATNGVIHLVNRVIYPIPDGTFPVALAANQNLSTLLFLLGQGQDLATLNGAGPFTLFAPTNQAFDKLPAGTISDLLSDRQRLAGLLEYHVVMGTHYSSSLTNESLQTLQGKKISFVVSSSGVMVNNSTIIKADITTSNGVMHILDQALSIT